MDQQKWDAMDEYLCAKTHAADDALDAALSASAHAGLPSINVAPNQGKLLQLLARLHGAQRILEIGTLGGYSSIWLARALPANGKLVSLEANADYAEVARRNVERAGLSRVVSIAVGQAAQTLEHFIRDNEPPFDFVFIDADKKSYPDYLRLSLRLSRPGTLLVADNVIRGGRLADAHSKDPDVIGLHRFFDMLASEKQLSSTAIQTVGSKGWDGFSLSIVSE
ncbi:O-methyltransferase [Caballeronia sp. Lep1P3]|uniref:O-methyltransferase n=1 Tax=Caballeronia sp. Lep1P3 TaxID=2878150 RepID=UPI001FD1A9EB|nr:O-methyltransferase [Caballeronia sp. Lep1P3]